MRGAPAIGALRRRVELLAPHDEPDGAGGAIRTVVSAGFAWASVTTIRRREAVEAGRPVGRLVHRIVMRAEAAAFSGMRVRDGGRRYRILTVEPADAKRRYLECLAEEEEP